MVTFADLVDGAEVTDTLLHAGVMAQIYTYKEWVGKDVAGKDILEDRAIFATFLATDTGYTLLTHFEVTPNSSIDVLFDAWGNDNFPI